MELTKTQKTIAILAGIVLLILMGVFIRNTTDEQNKAINNIQMRFAGQMSKCWQSVAETGGSCELEIIYQDGGQTPVTARVVRSK